MWHSWSLSVLLVLGGGVVPAHAQASSAKEPYRIRVPHVAGTAVRRAVTSVGRRLADPECRHVFTDFSATALGRPLGEVLESWGRTPEEQLATLVFKDGSGKARCGSPGVLAFTTVNGDTIYICAPQFARAVESDPSFAEIVLIHELLHTVGLGENPPSSREITARVTERCGDWRPRRAADRTPQPRPNPASGAPPAVVAWRDGPRLESGPLRPRPGAGEP